MGGGGFGECIKLKHNGFRVLRGLYHLSKLGAIIYFATLGHHSPFARGGNNSTSAESER